jgi:hypothetical protein
VRLQPLGHLSQVEKPPHQFLGMHHLFDRFLLRQLAKLVVAPVVAHFGVKEVLIDGSQFSLQDLVEQSNNFKIAFHSCLSRLNFVLCSTRSHDEDSRIFICTGENYITVEGKR